MKRAYLFTKEPARVNVRAFIEYRWYPSTPKTRKSKVSEENKDGKTH